jgi:hypothetical protein
VTVYSIVSKPPPEAPVTRPAVFIVALVLLLLHVPPVVASATERVAPAQMALTVPVIVPALRNAPTVTDSVVETVPQDDVIVYFMVSIPADTPLTKPVAEPIVACVLLADQVPPVVRSDSKSVVPAQRLAEPVIVPAVGAASTLTICVVATVPQLLTTP